MNEQEIIISKFQSHAKLSTAKRIDGMDEETIRVSLLYLKKYLHYCDTVGARSFINYLNDSDLAPSSKYLLAHNIGRFLYWNEYITTEQYKIVLQSFRCDESSHRGDDLTPEDVSNILTGLALSPYNVIYDKMRDLTILMTLSYLGARATQIVMMRLQDVEIDDDFLTLSFIRQKEVRKTIAPSYDVKKVSVNTTLFGYSLYNMYNEYMDYRMDLPVPSDALFISNINEPISYMTMYKLVKKWGKAVNKNICVHSFRRYVAQRVTNEKGVNVAKNILGHKSISTTERYLSQEAVI